MCGRSHRSCNDFMCRKLCGIVRLVMAGIVIGVITGMVGVYLFDRDRWLQYKAKKMLKGAQNLTSDIKSKLSGDDNGE